MSTHYEYLVESQTLRNQKGVQLVYKFPNGFGASVIKGEYSYGGKNNLWEIAPWNSSRDFIGRSLLDWEDDVLGHLNDNEVNNVLSQIKNL